MKFVRLRAAPPQSLLENPAMAEELVEVPPTPMRKSCATWPARGRRAATETAAGAGVKAGACETWPLAGAGALSPSTDGAPGPPNEGAAAPPLPPPPEL